jgi:lipoyl synthase
VKPMKRLLPQIPENPHACNAICDDLEPELWSAWQASRERHGNRLVVSVPGMFVVDGRRGKYRAVSITGNQCALNCDHCRGTLLKTMPDAATPERLLELAREAEKRGDLGMLVTGGCDARGGLPWEAFGATIARIKAHTGLRISVHTGILDAPTARLLKASGVDQALIDVIADETTARDVYHLPDAVHGVRRTLDALAACGLETVPHIIYGIHFGTRRGEFEALRMLRDYPLKKFVIVVLMPSGDTAMEQVIPPRVEEVARFLCRAREELPDPEMSLGCARPRGRYRLALDFLAVRAGINGLALPSDWALAEAERLGLEVVYQQTCCSVDPAASNGNGRAS